MTAAESMSRLRLEAPLSLFRSDITVEIYSRGTSSVFELLVFMTSSTALAATAPAHIDICRRPQPEPRSVYKGRLCAASGR